MDKLQNANSGLTNASRSSHPTLSREPSSALSSRTESWPSKALSQSSQTSAQTSVSPSPLVSREPSPTRPVWSSNNFSRGSSATPSTRSRKNSQQDISPTRPPRSNLPTPATALPRTLSAATTPTLLPPPADPAADPPGPQKPSGAPDVHRDPPRWPVSPRLRSPPPILGKPAIPPTPRKGDGESPAINVQRSTPSPQPPNLELVSDPGADETSQLQSGMRTPARATGGSSSTLETVQEASPLSSPKQGMAEGLENLADSVSSEAPSSQTTKHTGSTPNESGSENDNTKTELRPGAATATAAPPPLTSRQSTASMRHAGSKGKADAPLQSMTVETETVTSIPQVALEQSSGVQGTNGSLRTKPSSETIRPKKDKKKPARKSPAVNSGTVSSKADVFEAKVASAVEEANSSGSEETFVYDSNPPDGRDRPHRFHSRTPSATSMMSQVDRSGMRSIPSVMENAGMGIGAKKNMKFVNVNALNPNGTDIALGDEDGRGTGRSNTGSGRGTARYHHHFGRWGRSAGGNHRSIFADESPFQNGASPRSLAAANNSRLTSGPPSPRFSSGRGPNGTGRANGAGKRVTPLLAGYDLDNATTEADDERTPLLPATMRSARSTRSRRLQPAMRSMEPGRYRQQASFLNRFASCLVLTVMFVLVVSGAIGFMFATSQPLTDIELIEMKNVLASEQELMLDITVKARNPNVVVVAIDSADIEVFAKSPHAGTDSEWWRRPDDSGSFMARRRRIAGIRAEPSSEPSAADKPLDDKAPNMRLGTIRQFDSQLSFEGSFFHQGISSSTGEVRLNRPGNGTAGGSERWERILEDEFDLILKGVLRYSLPLSQRVRSVAVSGRTHVKPNSANEPTPPNPNNTRISVDF